MNIDRSFLDEVFGDAEGYAHFAVGRGAYVDETGKYKFGDWEQVSFSGHNRPMTRSAASMTFCPSEVPTISTSARTS